MGAETAGGPPPDSHWFADTARPVGYDTVMPDGVHTDDGIQRYIDATATSAADEQEGDGLG